MSRKPNKKGRNNAPRFVQVTHSMMDSLAWHSISSRERDLLLCIKRRYNGTNNGDIGVSLREGADYLSVTPATALKAFNRLCETGFIAPIVKGAFDWKLSVNRLSRSTRWLLTEHPQDMPLDCKSLTALRTYKIWKPSEEELLLAAKQAESQKERTLKATAAMKAKRKQKKLEEEQDKENSGVRPTYRNGTSNVSMKSPMGTSNVANGYVQRSHNGENQEVMGTCNVPVSNIPCWESEASASCPPKGQAQPEADGKTKVVEFLPPLSDKSNRPEMISLSTAAKLLRDEIQQKKLSAL
ncbi:MAG: hypothetical protein QNJ29_09915 [Rhizobiaceae bacterium]|nr:hypothetical protein [Rhizobiaceae bacterium]